MICNIYYKYLRTILIFIKDFFMVASAGIIIIGDEILSGRTKDPILIGLRVN